MVKMSLSVSLMTVKILSSIIKVFLFPFLKNNGHLCFNIPSVKPLVLLQQIITDYVVIASACPGKRKRTSNLAQNCAVHSFYFVHQIQLQFKFQVIRQVKTSNKLYCYDFPGEAVSSKFCL